MMPSVCDNVPSFKRLRAAAALSLALIGAGVRVSFAAPAAAVQAPVHFTPLAPGADASTVGQAAASVLEQGHYSHRSLDASVSREMLRLYLDSLDFNHLVFDQSDIDGFKARYGDTLAEKLEKDGDVAPAFEIFNRFEERLQQRFVLVKQLAEKGFDYSKDESILVDRHKAAWPAGDKQAEELWREQIKYEVLQERLNKAKPEDQAKNVVRRYERMLRNMSEYDSGDVLQDYLSALARALDPHSDYLGEPEKKNFDISMRLSVFGIGAVLTSEDGYAKVSSLVPGGPAARDKRLKPGDRIEAVAQGDAPYEDIVGMRLDHAVQLIRGDKGTKVRLKVIPADAIDPATRVEIDLTRDEVKLVDREAKAQVVEVPAGSGSVKLGVIDLPEFYADMDSNGKGKSAARDLAKLVGYLNKVGVQGIIVDLRHNGGGSLNEAVSLTGLFIDDGPVVQVKDSAGAIKELDTAPQDSRFSGPMVVLTGRDSASASEIFAGALQDYGRAVIVGAKSTFGKGTVQALVDLGDYMPMFYHGANPGTLKVTVQKFYRVSGASTQHKGVIPDIHLPDEEDDLDVTESSLDNALPYDEVPPASYKRWPVKASLQSLKTASQARVAASEEFNYIKDDGERLRKESQDKTVSLNEKTRLSEQDADKAREEARKKERLAHPAAPLKSVDVTLESIDGATTADAAQGALASAEPPAKSTGTKEGDYNKAPQVPDAALEESLDILRDIVKPPNELAHSMSEPAKAPVP